MTITLGSITSYVGGVLLALIGLGLLFSNVLAVLPLTIGVLILPPVRRRLPVEFSRGATFAFASLGYALIVVVLIGAMLGGGPTVEERTHQVGDSFTMQDTTYTITDVKTENAEGKRYVAVTLDAENVGDESKRVSQSQFSLLDKEEREFEPDDDGTVANILTGELLISEQVHPSETISGTIYFEVDGSGDYRVKVDPAFGGTHFVEIEV